MFGRGSQSLLAVDFAPDATRVVETQVRRGDVKVLGAVSELLPAGNTESLPDRHMEALGKIIAAGGIKSRSCVATLPTNMVVTRSVPIDLSKSLPAQDQIRMALQNSISYDMRELIFDFWKVAEASEKKRTEEVLVVAAQGSTVQRYLGGLKKLKLNCMHLDVAPCAVVSLVARLSPNAESLTGTVAICDNVGYFAVVDKSRVLFWRPFELSVHPAKSDTIVQQAQDRIGDEISKCVSHMAGSQHLDNLAELLVFGHGAGDEAFKNYLNNRFNMPVRSPSPFETLPAGTISEHIQLSASAASHYAASLGLALQPAGEANHG